MTLWNFFTACCGVGLKHAFVKREFEIRNSPLHARLIEVDVG